MVVMERAIECTILIFDWSTLKCCKGHILARTTPHLAASETSKHVIVGSSKSCSHQVFYDFWWVCLLDLIHVICFLRYAKLSTLVEHSLEHEFHVNSWFDFLHDVFKFWVFNVYVCIVFVKTRFVLHMHWQVKTHDRGSWNMSATLFCPPFCTWSLSWIVADMTSTSYAVLATIWITFKGIELVDGWCRQSSPSPKDTHANVWLFGVAWAILCHKRDKTSEILGIS